MNIVETSCCGTCNCKWNPQLLRRIRFYLRIPVTYKYTCISVLNCIIYSLCHHQQFQSQLLSWSTTSWNVKHTISIPAPNVNFNSRQTPDFNLNSCQTLKLDLNSCQTLKIDLNSVTHPPYFWSQLANWG